MTYPATNPNQAKGNDLRKWLQEIVLYDREFAEYHRRAKKIVKRYRDDDRKQDSGVSRYNILWSNVQTLGPALYGRTPKVQVERRFKDPDAIGRVSAHILERSTEYSIDSYDFDSVMRAVRDDYLLVGRGTAWVRYEPVVDGDQITYQEVLCDHVHWRDFMHSPAKQWRQVRWAGRWIYLSRKQLVERFGSDLGGKIPLDYAGRDLDGDEERKTRDQEEFNRARIAEIWDGENMEVLWLSKSYQHNILDRIEDPLGLRNFFPTPKPWYATTTTDSLVPIPDYLQYQDQAAELDDMTLKITLLTDALRIVGVYDASLPALGQLLTSTRQNEMIPVANWPAFVQQGGFQGAMQWMSIKEIVEALNVLYPARERLKADLYEITGISDIVRGNSSPTETATAQQIKGQFATLRLSDRQRDAQRYARDLIALKAEIIAEHFEPAIIAGMSGVDVSNPEVQQLFGQAVQVLQNDTLRSYKIDIETDSMVAVNEALDKQKRTEFLTAFGGFLEGTVKAAQAMPMLTPMLGEALLFLVRGYSAGRSLELSIEQAMQAMQQAAQEAAQGNKPDPEVMKVQAQMQLEQAKMQAHVQTQQQAAQLELQVKQAEFQLKQAEMALRSEEAKQKVQLESFKLAKGLEHKEAELQLTASKAATEIELQREKIRGDHAIAASKAAADMQLKQYEMQNWENVETKKALIKQAGEEKQKDEEEKKAPKKTRKRGNIAGRDFEMTEEEVNGKRRKSGRIGNRKFDFIEEAVEDEARE